MGEEIQHQTSTETATDETPVLPLVTRFQRPANPPREKSNHIGGKTKWKAYYWGLSSRANFPDAEPPAMYRPGTKNYDDWVHGWLDGDDLAKAIEAHKRNG